MKLPYIEISINDEIDNECVEIICYNENENGIKEERVIYTDENYYNNGLLRHLYNIKNCDHNWLLGKFIISELDIILDKCFYIGFGKGGFIKGINKSVDNFENHKWAGIDERNKLDDFNNLIDRYNYDDICNYNNIKNIIRIIKNRFNKINLIFNNVLPKGTKRNIILSLIILSKTLAEDGIIVTRISNNSYSDIILLMNIFKYNKIIKYPVCKNKKIKFRYYLICQNKKKCLYNDAIVRKIAKCLDINKKIQITTDDIKYKIMHFFEKKDNPKTILDNLIQYL